VRKVLSSALLALSVSMSMAHAAEPGSPVFTFQGFGTLALDYHDEDADFEYRRNTSQARGVQANQLDLATDSRAGIQANLSIRDDVQVVAQAVTRQGATGDWSPRVERAFVRFNPGADTFLRLGRIGYDSYLLAESPDVGYSYLPIRPAPEFFGLFATDDVDGADAAFTRQIGEGLGRIRLFGGNSRGKQVYAHGVATPTNSDVFGGQLDYGIHSWLVRAGLVDVHVRKTPDFSALANALRATGVAQSASLASALQDGSRSIRAFQIAVAYDGRPLEAQVLLTRVESHMIAAPRVNSGFAVVGYRYRQATPFVSLAAVRSYEDILPTGLPEAGSFASLDSAARAAQTALQANQRTASAGVRFDVTPRLDLKFQVDRVHFHDTNLIFDRATPAPGGRNLTLFGIAADFVF
jgi:hypothetical protein